MGFSVLASRATKVAIERHLASMLATDRDFKVESSFLMGLSGDFTTQRLHDKVLGILPSAASSTTLQQVAEQLQFLMKSKLYKFSSKSCQGEVQVCNEWVQTLDEPRSDDPAIPRSESHDPNRAIRVPRFERYPAYVCDSSRVSRDPGPIQFNGRCGYGDPCGYRDPNPIQLNDRCGYRDPGFTSKVQTMMLGRAPGSSQTNSFLGNVRSRMQYLCNDVTEDGSNVSGKAAVMAKLEKIKQVPEQDTFACA